VDSLGLVAFGNAYRGRNDADFADQPTVYCPRSSLHALMVALAGQGRLRP